MLPAGEPLLFYAGALMCVAVATQVTLGLVGWTRQRSEQRRQSDAGAANFRRLVAAEAAAASARLSRRLAWEGRRELRVASIIDEAAGVRSFYLTAPDGMPLPRFLPGQYLTIAAPVGSRGEDVLRCYSLSDRPRPEYYRLTVKRQPAPADTPDAPEGRCSSWLHQHVREGATLRCEAPRGAFFLDPASPRPAVLIGAGVGVTPLVSMLAATRHERSGKPVYAAFAFRDCANHVLREAIDELRDAGHLRVRIAYSRPRPEDRLGVDYELAGRVTIDTLRAELPSNNFDFYLCGPPTMMQTLVPELLDWGVPDDAIHYEAFGPASVRTPGAASLAERAVGSAVRFKSLGEDPLDWDGACATLLELAESRGVPVASGCRAGNCGACRVRVLSGAVTPLKPTGVAIDEGECLACISLPDGQVVLDA